MNANSNHFKPLIYSLGYSLEHDKYWRAKSVSASNNVFPTYWKANTLKELYNSLKWFNLNNYTEYKSLADKAELASKVKLYS